MVGKWASGGRQPCWVWSPLHCVQLLTWMSDSSMEADSKWERACAGLSRMDHPMVHRMRPSLCFVAFMHRPQFLFVICLFFFKLIFEQLLTWMSDSSMEADSKWERAWAGLSRMEPPMVHRMRPSLKWCSASSLSVTPHPSLLAAISAFSRCSFAACVREPDIEPGMSSNREWLTGSQGDVLRVVPCYDALCDSTPLLAGCRQSLFQAQVCGLHFSMSARYTLSAEKGLRMCPAPPYATC